MPDKPFKVGASTRVSNLPEIIDWIKESQRDLELVALGGMLEPNKDLKAAFKDVPAMLDGYTGRFGVHGPILSSGGMDADMVQIVIRRYMEYLEVCGEIKASHLVIHSPFLSLGAPFPPAFTEAYIIQPMLGILRQLIPTAESIQCTIVIENVWDQRPQDLRRLVEACESDYVRMSLDTGHAFVMNRWGEGPLPDYWVREAGPMLAHIHIQDTDGYTDRHWPPGQGQVGWHGFFQALTELDHEPRLILEVSNSANVMQGFNYLKAHGFVE